MRTVFSKYMDGESVCLVAEILKCTKPRFNGKERESSIDPTTGLSPAVYFYDPDHPEENIDLSKATLIKPIRINQEPLDIDHMWVAQNLHQPVGTIIEIRGHIKSYTKSNGYMDYCISPYNVIPTPDPNRDPNANWSKQE